MTTVLPNLYHIFSATFALSNSQRSLVITHGGFSASVTTAPALNTAWRNALLTVGGARPFSPAQMPTFLQCVSTNVLLKTGGLLYSDTNNTAVAGSGSINPPPANSAILINKVTGVAGRAYRGRMFAPVTTDESNIGPNGVIGPTFVTTLQGYWNTAMTQLTGAGVIPMLLHSDPLITPTTVTTWTVDELVGTLKRRLRR